MAEVEDPKAPARGERALRERRAREARLAQELRANLAKRKAQSRERRAAGDKAPEPDDRG